MNAPTMVSNDDGTGAITVSGSDQISYTRSNATPVGEFNANISLTISVRDDSEADGQILTTTATPFNAIPFDSGNLFRYGRLRMQNVSGSQLIAAPIRLEAQYWSNTAFITNTADHCTTIVAGNVALGNYQRNLNAGETTVSGGGAFNAGVGSLRLSAPGAANNGSVDVSINLTGGAAGNSCTAGMPASTGSSLSHLQGAWCGAPYSRDPTARATFGVNTNTDRMIYQRENF
jgi:MSHA biogenesis protein MshQ